MKKTRQINPKFRWLINIFFILIMILTIIFGSIFYLKPKLNVNNSNIQGTRISLKIKESLNENLKSNELPSSNNILKITKEYLQNENLLSSIDLNLSSNDVISVNSYTHIDDIGKQKLVNSLVNKPYITFTDEKGNPVFYKNQFITRLGEESKRKTLKDFMDGNPYDFMPQLAPNPANDKNKQGLSGKVTLKFTEDGWSEFISFAGETALMYYYGQYFSKLATNAYIWINLKEFVEIAKRDFPEEWKAAGENPVNFAYVGNDANPQQIQVGVDKDGKPITKEVPPVLKTSSINASKYLITVANPFALRTSNVNDSSIYLLNDNKHGYTDHELASAINFAMSPFEFKEEQSHFLTTNSKSTNKYFVVIMIIFALIAIYLLVRYRLFGFVSIVTLGFFVFLLFIVLAALNIFISPILAITIIASLIIAFLLISNQLNHFKKEILDGSNAIKAISKSIKHTVISSMDSIAAGIVSVLFAIFISVSYSTSIGMLFFVSMLLSFFIIIILQTLLLRSIVKTESFNDSSKALLYANYKLHQKMNKIDLISKSKFFTIGFAIFVVIALISYFSIAGYHHSLKEALNLSLDLNGGWEYILLPKQGMWNKENINQISVLFNSNIDVNLNAYLQNISQDSYIIIINQTRNNIVNELNNIIANNEILKDAQLITNVISPVNLNFDIGMATIIISASILVSSIYLSIRYSISAGIILWIKQTFAIALVFLTLMMSFGGINLNVIDGLILFTLYNIVDTVIQSSKVKEEFSKDLNTKNYVYSKDQIKELFRLSIINSFELQVTLVSLAFVLFILVIPFMSSLKLSILITFASGMIFSTLQNILLLPLIWMHMEIKKYERKQKRISKSYWNSKKVEEQTFIGINDYSI
ncbi:protein translocase subunit SecDF [[Mycoplasma] anseris]|uniref:Bifunctional preprotein translocase subunit SecD/SecF n=1 Tax=[Mycoplasma] anseris TaxID=92400 RepID=A0A2Z4NCE3_9BACT|nr:hypothetical protein [[Mycoplasma] anseris]AWX69224.1 hypothetical protein DP065_00410 [[Mycoplasma] anseris]